MPAESHPEGTRSADPPAHLEAQPSRLLGRGRDDAGAVRHHRLVAPRPTAFWLVGCLFAVTMLGATLPTLTDAARATLVMLSPERWRVIRNEAARVLYEVESTQLRDTDVPTQRQFLSRQ